MDGTFLHSPLLDELKSLETTLLRKAYRQRRAALKRHDDGSTGSRAGVEEALAKKPSCRVELPNQVCILVCLPVSSISLSLNSAHGRISVRWQHWRLLGCGGGPARKTFDAAVDLPTLGAHYVLAQDRIRITQAALISIRRARSALPCIAFAGWSFPIHMCTHASFLASACAIHSGCILACCSSVLDACRGLQQLRRWSWPCCPPSTQATPSSSTPHPPVRPCNPPRLLATTLTFSCNGTIGNL